MAKAWRFIKWYLGKTTWFELGLFAAWGSLVIGLANEGPVRNTAWTIAILIAGIAMLKFLWWGCKEIWADFKRHDEQVFDILKKDDIK
jgi:hypothetical protein